MDMDRVGGRIGGSEAGVIGWGVGRGVGLLGGERTGGGWAEVGRGVAGRG